MAMYSDSCPCAQQMKCLFHKIIILRYSLESSAQNFYKLVEPPGCTPGDHSLLFNVLFFTRSWVRATSNHTFLEGTLLFINCLIYDQQKSIALCDPSKKPHLSQCVLFKGNKTPSFFLSVHWLETLPGLCERTCVQAEKPCRQRADFTMPRAIYNGLFSAGKMGIGICTHL